MAAEIRFPAMRSTVAGSESTNATYSLGLLGGLDKFSLILKVLTDFNMCSGERKAILYADADKSGPQFFGLFFFWQVERMNHSVPTGLQLNVRQRYVNRTMG